MRRTAYLSRVAVFTLLAVVAVSPYLAVGYAAEEKPGDKIIGGTPG